MTDRRALLTDREREIISGEGDVSDSYRYQTISRIRARFDRLDGDLQALESHGTLADELRDEICPTDTADGHTQPPREGRESVETRPRDERDRSPAPAADEPSTAGAVGEGGDAIDDAVDKAAESWEDNEARLAARKNAARAVLKGLRERPMSRGEMVDRYYDDYDISGQNEDTWYRKNLAECDNAPLKAVASYNSGTRKWEFDAGDSGGDQ